MARAPKGPNTIRKDIFTHYHRRPLHASQLSVPILLRRVTVRERHCIRPYSLHFLPGLRKRFLAFWLPAEVSLANEARVVSSDLIFTCIFFHRSFGMLGIRNLGKLSNSFACHRLESYLASASLPCSGRTPDNLRNTRGFRDLSGGGV